MIFEIKSISAAAKKIIELAGLAQVFNLPETQTANNDAPTINAANIENAQEPDQVDINLEDSETISNNSSEEPAAESKEDEVEMNFEVEEPAAESKEDEVEMNFEVEEPAAESNKVDKVEKSGENSAKSKDSGDSGSDDFEFKPGTFE
jgi:hypothetical protein